MFFDLVVVGGGAAGFFAAITCAENSSKSVLILEKTSQVLHKVKISGGGRCNVTHECFDPRELTQSYPRGEKSLIGPFHRFGVRDTIDWFASRGVTLTTESDGRMFPDTDSSQTIVDTLLDAATSAGVEIHTSSGVASIERDDAGFELVTDAGDRIGATSVLIATGGTRLAAGARLAAGLGHTLEPPTPSLFTFRIRDPRLDGLLGVSVDPAEVRVVDSRLESSGPVLVTHWGLSGPGILRISAWGARELAARDHRFEIDVNWLPGVDPTEVFAARRRDEARRRLSSRSAFETIPKRLWLRLLDAAGISPDTTWAQLPRAEANRLTSELTASRFRVGGKSTNKDEFVTCGGVSLDEIDFRTMESKLVPGLFFAGEVVDVDGITGGFNFQNAWTGGHHAGSTVASR